MTDTDLDYRALFESAPGLYLVLDANLNVVTATDTYCRATNFDWRKASGTPYFEILDAAIAERGYGESTSLRESFGRVLSTRRRDAMPIQRFDLPNEAGVLEERHWSVMNVPLLGKDGDVRLIVHRIRDMTEALRNQDTIDSNFRLAREQDDMIAALRAANRELADRDRLPGDTARLSRLNTIAMMTGAIAHDMSQPLLSAMNYLSAFRRRANADRHAPVSLDLIEKAEGQLKRAAEIVRDLRGLIAGDPVKHSPEDINEVILEALKACEVTFRQRQIETEFPVNADIPRVTMDKTQLKQVFVNVLCNAAEAMTDTAKPKITVWAQAVDRHIDIEVSDNGPGIPAAEREKIFRPFYTEKDRGLGLGLAVCHEIVALHGGTIEALSGCAGGTTIVIKLPISSRTPS